MTDNNRKRIKIFESRGVLKTIKKLSDDLTFIALKNRTSDKPQTALLCAGIDDELAQEIIGQNAYLRQIFEAGEEYNPNDKCSQYLEAGLHKIHTEMKKGDFERIVTAYNPHKFNKWYSEFIKQNA